MKPNINEVIINLMNMNEEEQAEFFYTLDENETLEYTRAFWEALEEMIIEESGADHSIPSWEEVEEILNMESERGIK